MIHRKSLIIKCDTAEECGLLYRQCMGIATCERMISNLAGVSFQLNHCLKDVFQSFKATRCA